jgi:hypothetical protein
MKYYPAMGTQQGRLSIFNRVQRDQIFVSVGTAHEVSETSGNARAVTFSELYIFKSTKSAAEQFNLVVQW